MTELSPAAQSVIDRLRRRYPLINPQTVANSLRAAADALDSLQDFKALMALADELDPPAASIDQGRNPWSWAEHVEQQQTQSIQEES